MSVPRDGWRNLCDQVADCVERPAWQQRAACRGKPPNLFFPTVSHAGRFDPLTVAALGRGEKFGVWGGRVFGAKSARRVEVA